jgi:hemerythrin-like metal-binding protein
MGNELRSVGVQLLDEEHQVVLELINNLVDLVSRVAESDCRPFVDRGLERIESCITGHFKHEEDILASVKYPDLEMHRAIHQSICETAIRIRSRFDRWPTYSGAKKLSHSLQATWISHVNNVDAAYADYLSTGPLTLRSSL